MSKEFFAKPVINKRNGQINISLKKKNLPKKLVKDILSVKKLKLILEDWE